MNRRRRGLALATVAIAAALCHEPLQTKAQESKAQESVALELVLAIDSSASVDEREFKLQVGGIAEAFRHPEVIGAIESLGRQGMAVTLVQWSGPENSGQVLPFAQVHDGRTAKAFGFLVSLTQRRSTTGTTAMANAVLISANLMEANGFAGDRRVIDVSGDGRNNTPPELEGVRDAVVERGFTINGLAILNDDPRLDDYYRKSLIGGKDAFVEVAADYAGFARAIRQKLIREIYPPLSKNGQEGRRMTRLIERYWLARAP
jgi:hypothetical protein